MPNSDSATEQAIRAEHLATLYRLMPRSLPFYPLIGAMLTVTLWENASHPRQTLFQALDTTLHISHENQALREKAERASAAKTRFLAAASHDLRQPLHALGLFIATLAMQVRAPRTEALLQRIDEALGSVGTMLTSILDISKLDAGIIEPKPETVDLGELFIRLEQEFTPIAAENGNQLRFRRTRLLVQSDPALYEHSLRNLIANACRYTHNGRILVVARMKNGKVRYEVRDTGPGIAPEQQQSIFEEFYQLDNPERDRKQGMGLGLAIVQRNIDLLGHSLELDSTPGHGACFSVLAQSAAAPAAPTATNDNKLKISDLADATILLVDDDPIIVTAMSALLDQWDCRILNADSPDTALALLERIQRKPDVILADYRLKDGITGNQVIDAVRDYCKAPIPAIIITGDTTPDRLREATQAGYPLLHKPVEPELLRSALQALLQSQGLAQQ